MAGLLNREKLFHRSVDREIERALEHELGKEYVSERERHRGDDLEHWEWQVISQERGREDKQERGHDEKEDREEKEHDRGDDFGRGR